MGICGKIIEECIMRALEGKSKLIAEILDIDGMSSVTNRHLFNNMGAIFDKFNYLEIGVHKGSTYISSLYKNNVIDAWAIDDWSQFEDQSDLFIDNCLLFDIPVNFLDVNCFSIDVTQIRDIDFYFYDGHHGMSETAKGLIHFYDSFSDKLLYIVDDFDWPEVRDGTAQGIEECNLDIEYYKHLAVNIENGDNWWNGLGIFILNK